jgi:hypothetical protein
MRQSDLVREIAREKFVVPARNCGLNEVVIPVIKLRDLLVPRGFPPNNIPQICSALEAKAFRNEFEEVQIEGPASKRSTTVVFRCFFHRPESFDTLPKDASPADETPAERAKRVTDSLFGALKDEIASFGGAEAFLRWVRSEDEEDAE